MAEIAGDGHSVVSRWASGGVRDDASSRVRALLLTTHAILTGKPSQGGTPRDTGRAASGWIPSVGAPTSFVPPEGGAAQVADAEALVPTTGVPFGTTHFETNLVPYIGPLGRGHSKQAAAGWIPRAVKKAIRRTGGKLA